MVRSRSLRNAALFFALQILTLVGASLSVNAAPFVNLDFEQASVIPVGSDPRLIQAGPAFPGWTARLGSSTLSTVYHDFDGIGEGAVALYDHAANDLGIPLLQGQYMAALLNDITPALSASLEQVGDVPTGSRSLHFLTSRTLLPPLVTVNETTLPLTLLASNIHTETSEWGVDVTGFAGTAAALRFSTTRTGPPSGPIFGLDDVRFSPSPIPEPATGWLPVVVATLFHSITHKGRVSQDRVGTPPAAGEARRA